MSHNHPYYAAAYIRLSREDGDKAESDSIANQKKLIADFIKDSGDFTLYDTYIDDGYTGTRFDRPAFLRMLTDIETGNINCVIVKDLSRFGRDYIDTGKYLERYFPEKKVRFVSITDHIDSARQAYDMLLPIKNIFNEQYARDISQKIHASVSTKQKAGEFIGAFPSYGYQKSPADKNKLVIDEYAAQIVRRIFDLYRQGFGKIRIAGILNEEGIVCPSEYKKLSGQRYRNSNRLNTTSYWTYSTVNRILQNEMYIGNMVQGKKFQQMRGKAKAKDPADWIVVPQTHEAIIDQTTWECVQDLLKRRTRTLRLDRNQGVFAGFLKCGDCGRSLVKKTPAHKADTESVYYCGTYVRSGRQFCTPHKIPHTVLADILQRDLQILLNSTGDLQNLARLALSAHPCARQPSESEVQKTQTELDKVRKLKKAVYEDYQDGLLSKEECLSYRQDYQKKEELLAKRLSALSTPSASRPALPHSPWLSRLLSTQSVESLDRQTIAAMLSEIKVYESNTVKITYRFRKNTNNRFPDTYVQDRGAK